MRLFDTHAHYDDEAFDGDRDELLASLPDRGVEWVVNPGCTVDSSRQALALSRRFPHVRPAVGIHPETCADAGARELAEIAAMAREAGVVAIGEIGLDYYWPENPPKEHQKDIFRRQLLLARELDLPVIIHDRDAHGDCFSILREFPALRGVFHCYSGSVELAQELLKRGWYLGFDGPITYKNARRAPQVAAITPLERMLVETDAPYLAPVPHRGKRNDSGYVSLVVEKLAEWKGVTPEALAEITLENGKRLFGMTGGDVRHDDHHLCI